VTLKFQSNDSENSALSSQELNTSDVFEWYSRWGERKCREQKGTQWDPQGFSDWCHRWTLGFLQLSTFGLLNLGHL